LISKILVAVDGSASAEKALDYAIELAKKTSNNLLIINVIEEFGELMNRWKEHDKLVKDLKRERTAMLDKYESRAKEAGIENVHIIRAEGNAAEKILQSAEDKRIDTIILGSRGLSTTKEFLLGSVSHNVIHHAKCSVIIAK
jgi:nucleotide-binding universal stress UspA family protein